MPASMAPEGFREKVMMALPFVRNNSSSDHGAGATPARISRPLAKLAINLAAALNPLYYNMWNYNYIQQQAQQQYHKSQVMQVLDSTHKLKDFLRDLSMHAYLGEEEVATFTQIQRIGDDDAILLGNEGAYTFVIPENGACRFDLEYMLKEADVPGDKKQFDALIMTYFDEKNGIHKFHLMDIERCWSLGEVKTEKKWITLTKG